MQIISCVLYTIQDGNLIDYLQAQGALCLAFLRGVVYNISIKEDRFQGPGKTEVPSPGADQLVKECV